MYQYTYSSTTGGILLDALPCGFSKEPRPVYPAEMDILGFEKYFDYTKLDAPICWAQAASYFYRGAKIAQTHGGSCYKKPVLEVFEPYANTKTKLEPIDLVQMTQDNKDIMAALVQNTIKRVYNTYTKYKDKVDVFYVAFSGGKDSVVTLDIVQKALPHNAFKVVFADTQMEFPDTYSTVHKTKEYCQKQNIEFYTARSHLSPQYTWGVFGPPAQTIRWCCSVHKTAPQILLLRDITKKPNFTGMAFTGIRKDESASRREYDILTNGKKHQGQYSFHTIIDWGSAEVFLYIYENKLLLNSAYKKGNSRAGCLVCPMEAAKNAFFKEVSYSKNDKGMKTTTDFNQIILETTVKEFDSSEAKKEFMNIGGWKARRSGRDISMGKNLCIYSLKKNIFEICVKKNCSDWKEWLKTIGAVSYTNENNIIIEYEKKLYKLVHKANKGNEVFTVDIGVNTITDIHFVSFLKKVFRKSAYCIYCKVCVSNCPYGFINMDNNKLKIDNRCIKCKKCYDIERGCLVANSNRVPEGERIMKGKAQSVSRYTNMGVEFSWVKKYFEFSDKAKFWDSANGLGSKMIKNLKYFLYDAGVIEKSKITLFGEAISRIGVENTTAWGLMLSNLTYTAQLGWWVKNIAFNTAYNKNTIIEMLPDTLSDISKKSVVDSYKHIFYSNTYLKTMGVGIPNVTIKKTTSGTGDITLVSFVRTPWMSADSRVILYSLYKFCEGCGDYRHFTLRTLEDTTLEREGVSPCLIFGLKGEDMKKILIGLAIKYPRFLDVSFTLGLDNIDLKEGVTSGDVLELF